MAFVVTPLKAFTAAPQGQGNKAKIYVYQVDPLLLEEEEGFNLRYYDDPKVEAHIEAFCEAYMNDHFVPPMMVRALEDGRIVLVEGHCRRRGVLRAIERGADIPLVSVIPFRGNDTERVEVMLRSAEGLKLETLDVARGYQRLLDMGFKPADIAASMNKSPARVEQLLTLAAASEDVQAMVRGGQVSADAAIEALRDEGANAATALIARLAAARLEGRQRITKATTRERAVPRRTVASVFGQVEAAMAKITPELQAKARVLRRAPEGKTVEIEAEILLGLMQAGKEIARLKARRAKQQERRAAAQPETP